MVVSLSPAMVLVMLVLMASAIAETFGRAVHFQPQRPGEPRLTILMGIGPQKRVQVKGECLEVGKHLAPGHQTSPAIHSGPTIRKSGTCWNDVGDVVAKGWHACRLATPGIKALEILE